uniref:Uncharacterized protein n=1 Tax=Fagus sylvatica TaxID=28930 RepID=A0A2N9EYH2_FAGSY
MRWWWRGFGCHEVWLVVSLGFDLTAGVGVGFDLVAGVGDRFGCGLLGWVWEGMESSRRSPFLTLPLGSHSLSLSRSHLRFSRSHLRHWSLTLTLGFLTSRSHFRRDLTSVTHGLDLSPSHLSGSRSCRRLTLAISPPPLVLDSLTH